MRAVIILIIAILGGLFILSFGGGLGYAKGGGSVELFPRTVTASSESGQAVAVWGDIENFNANNTPLPKPAPGRTFWDAAPMLGLLVVAGGFLWMFVGHLKPAGDGEWQADPDIKEHCSGQEAKENKRRYS